MEFIKTSDATIPAEAVYIRLKKELGNGKKVLWLMCGGSNIAAEVSILKKIIATNLANKLHVMLMDERYGPVGHADSNWQQLQEAGCDFTAVQATPVLSESLKSLAETIAAYSQRVQTAVDQTDITIGLFGLGVDGHTAGILPNTPAAHETDRWVVGYEAPPLTRITLTRPALLNVTAAYVFAFGQSKKPALSDLNANQRPFTEMPAKLHWELSEAYIYNDQVGDE